MKFNSLISVDDLAKNLNNPDFLVIDCRFELADPTAGYEHYKESHIPGAYYADLKHDLSGIPTLHTGRHPLPEDVSFSNKLHTWGVQSSTQIVAYDAEGGAMAAGRLWWLLRVYGHANAAVLDGGISAWINHGNNLDEDIPQPRIPSTTQFKFNPSWMIDMREMEKIISTDEFIVVDARAENRFHGRDEIIDVSGGHIPGAINLPYSKCFTPDGHYLPKENLKSIYESIGLVEQSGKKPVFYCGSGVTSVVHLLGMMYSGLGQPLIYPGSWSEWIKDPKHEIAVI